MKKLHHDLSRGLSMLALSTALALGACGDDGGSESGDDSTGEDSATSMDSTMGTMTDGETTGPMMCIGTDLGMVADGGPCGSNSDCMSGVCLLFNDAPPNDDAVCGEVPANCETRITATLRNLTDSSPIANQQVNIVKALDGITNPTGATPLATATSGADGRVDTLTTEAVNAPFGIVSVITGGEFFTTATGVSAPNDMNLYAVGAGIHEFWAVPAASLTEWSTALGEDTAIDAELLPLGEKGGVVGLVRDASNGMPISGATVAPDSESSEMIIRDLQDDGSFTADMGTGSAGIFVALNVMTTGEDFTIAAGALSGSGTAGSADNVVFSLIVDAS